MQTPTRSASGIPASGVRHSSADPPFFDMEWNAENQLTRVTKDSVEVARFKYDPLGRRVEKVAGAVTYSYTYDGEDILREGRGAATFKYAHGPGIDEPLAREDDSSTLTYYHTDALDSIVKRTSHAGSVIHEYRYDAWGEILLGGNDPGYAFTGREWDPETELHYYRARYYVPKLGRFANEDPLGFVSGENFHSYALNRPTSQADPSGLWTPVSELLMKLYISVTVEPEKIRKIQTEVNRDVESKPYLTPGNGGSMDAYRHCLIGCRLESETTTAHRLASTVYHEVENIIEGQSAAELRWDWWNYNLGAQCAASGPTDPTGPTSCASKCMRELMAGHLGGRKGVPQRLPAR